MKSVSFCLLVVIWVSVVPWAWAEEGIAFQPCHFFNPEQPTWRYPSLSTYADNLNKNFPGGFQFSEYQYFPSLNQFFEYTYKIGLCGHRPATCNGGKYPVVQYETHAGHVNPACFVLGDNRKGNLVVSSLDNFDPFLGVQMLFKNGWTTAEGLNRSFSLQMNCFPFPLPTPVFHQVGMFPIETANELQYNFRITTHAACPEFVCDNVIGGNCGSHGKCTQYGCVCEEGYYIAFQGGPCQPKTQAMIPCGDGKATLQNDGSCTPLWKKRPNQNPAVAGLSVLFALVFIAFVVELALVWKNRSLFTYSDLDKK